MADNNDDDDYRDARVPDLSVLAERQRVMMRRLQALEKKQSEIDRLMNRGFGGAALLIGLGVFVGWLFAVGGNLVRFFKSAS